MARILYSRAVAVNASNCLIKNPLQMGIVASDKNPLQIERSYLQCFDIGGGDEVKDEGEAGSYSSDSGSVPRGKQEGEGSDSGAVHEHHGLQSLVRSLRVTPSGPAGTS